MNGTNLPTFLVQFVSNLTFLISRQNRDDRFKPFLGANLAPMCTHLWYFNICFQYILAYRSKIHVNCKLIWSEKYVTFGVNLVPLVCKSDIPGRKRLTRVWTYFHICFKLPFVDLFTLSRCVWDVRTYHSNNGQRKHCPNSLNTFVLFKHIWMNLFALSSVDRSKCCIDKCHSLRVFCSPIRLISLIVHFGRRFPISWLQTYVYFHFHHHVSCCKFM